MIENIKNNQQNNNIRLMGKIISSLPFFAYRILREYLRFKGYAEKGGKIFKAELLSQGIRPPLANDLTVSYLESRDLMMLIKR